MSKPDQPENTPRALGRSLLQNLMADGGPASDAPPPACRPRRLGESFITKNGRSPLPGECIRDDEHDCDLPEDYAEPEPLKKPRRGTYVEVRWRGTEGLLLVWEANERVESWYDEATGHDENHRGPTLFISGWIYEVGVPDPNDTQNGLHFTAVWIKHVPHTSHADGDSNVRWNYIEDGDA